MLKRTVLHHCQWVRTRVSNDVWRKHECQVVTVHHGFGAVLRKGKLGQEAQNKHKDVLVLFWDLFQSNIYTGSKVTRLLDTRVTKVGLKLMIRVCWVVVNG